MLWSKGSGRWSPVQNQQQHKKKVRAVRRRGVPRKAGAPKAGAPKAGAPKAGAPKAGPCPATVSFLPSSLGSFRGIGGVESRKCARLEFSDCRVKPHFVRRREWSRGRGRTEGRSRGEPTKILNTHRTDTPQHNTTQHNNDTPTPQRWIPHRSWAREVHRKVVPWPKKQDMSNKSQVWAKNGLKNGVGQKEKPKHMTQHKKQNKRKNPQNQKK